MSAREVSYKIVWWPYLFKIPYMLNREVHLLNILYNECKFSYYIILILTTHKIAINTNLKSLLTARHKVSFVHTNSDWRKIPCYIFKQATLLIEAVCRVKIFKENAGSSVQTLFCRYTESRSVGWRWAKNVLSEKAKIRKTSFHKILNWQYSH